MMSFGWPDSAPKRILVSVAVVSFTAGIALAALVATHDAAPVTYADIFDVPVVDLGASGERGVDGFIGSPNMAPGDRMKGTLSLFVDREPPEDTMDLDFRVRPTLRGFPGEHRLDKSLVVTHLSYGADDLLRGEDGGRNLTATLDADGDSRLDLAEIAGGANDLAPPRARLEGGTAFVMEVAFRPDPRATSQSFQGQQLELTFVFRLADATSEDLE